MIAELALYLTSTVASRARRVGLVGESVGVWSRGRRRRREWAAHEARCHAIVRRALIGLPRRRRLAVLGSGFVRDAPFDELCEAFERVLLVDAVHPPQARWRARRRGNVDLLARDLSGVLAWMTGEGAARIDPVADLVADDDIDLVISANLLSQLPVQPEAWLERRPDRARDLPEDIANRLIGWHLDDLARFRCRVCLLTDVTMMERARDGVVIETLDLLRGHHLPAPEDEWDWTVAPFGELERDAEFIHRVHGYSDLHRAMKDSLHAGRAGSAAI